LWNNALFGWFACGSGAMVLLLLALLLGCAHAQSNSIYLLDPVLPTEAPSFAPTGFVKCPNDKLILFSSSPDYKVLLNGTNGGAVEFVMPGSIVPLRATFGESTQTSRYYEINGNYGMSNIEEVLCALFLGN
jgi:hypothetical protein